MSRLSALTRSCLRRSWRGAVAVALALSAFTIAFAAEAHASGPDYRLGPADKIRVKVSEWRPMSGDTFEWTALSSEFTVNSVGVISIPVVGSIQAEGNTTAEIARIISDRLKAAAGLVRSPDAAVEIVQYRPFYIMGMVDKPGEYAFRPGLSVVQAVSIAGGFYRTSSGLQRFEREALVTAGDIQSNQTQRLALLMRRDRLLAEAQNADRISFSTEVTKHPEDRAAALGMEEETALFVLRRTAIRSQAEMLLQAKGLLEDEIKTLAAKGLALKKQSDLVRKELGNIGSLVSEGLAVNARQLATAQNLAQIESQSLDVIVATARTRQEISRTERSVVELRNQRASEVGAELRDTQVALKQATDRIASLRLLIEDSSSAGTRFMSQAEAQRLAFSIVRRVDGKLQESAALQLDPVLPGDIVKIERVTSQTLFVNGAPADPGTGAASGGPTEKRTTTALRAAQRNGTR